ncbi:hypothetical protein MM300_02065 [Evansella sp. LMS18]|uniref:hypothetical protein n=1 Tax=Evansella sp. LMS18 TaxID=2924033 RepID=UPI0020D10847|nr:hypothetical protein [Evansella sp. LMS18]UTR11139.1 hypothetical protein MM300_02065 [Evansella sp. LMS18]
MLQVKISYSGEQMLYGILSALGFKYDNSRYSLKLSPKAGGPLVLTNHPADKEINLTFPEEVTMEDCIEINRIIEAIAGEIDGKVDDSEAHLGYDKDGNKKFIYHGFNSWAEFIDDARHKTLEGQKVAVKHGDEIMGEGILLTLDRAREGDKVKVISCTLVTTSGEQSFYGDDLQILPVTTWQ